MRFIHNALVFRCNTCHRSNLYHSSEACIDSVCAAIKCAPLSDPAGGSTIPRKCGTSFGDRCDFLCTEGQCPYQCDRAMLAAGDLPWNRVTKVPRVCQADKTWSGPEFFCESKRSSSTALK